MIKEVLMYNAECDECGIEAEFGDFSALTDKSSVEEDCTAQEWYFDDLGEKCYCEDCKTKHL